MKNDSKAPTAADAFYNHLDVCAQCEKHPFDLCVTGARLVRAAATNPAYIDSLKRGVSR
jgi:hypothetical protein